MRWDLHPIQSSNPRSWSCPHCRDLHSEWFDPRCDPCLINRCKSGQTWLIYIYYIYNLTKHKYPDLENLIIIDIIYFSDVSHHGDIPVSCLIAGCQCYIAMERSTMLLIGKPSISMGHLYHGYVSHNQVGYLQWCKCPNGLQLGHWSCHQSTGVPFKKSHGKRYDYHEWFCTFIIPCHPFKKI